MDPGGTSQRPIANSVSLKTGGEVLGIVRKREDEAARFMGAVT